MTRTARIHVLALVIWALATMPSAAQSFEELSPSSAPPPMEGHSLVTAHDDAFLFGGRGNGGVVYDDLWQWDRSAETWEMITPVNSGPVGRVYHSATELFGNLVIGYGLSASGELLDDVWMYSPYYNEWSQFNVSDGPAAHYLGAMSHLGDGNVFVASGYVSLSNPNDPENGINMYLLPIAAQAKIHDVTARHINSLSEGRYGGFTTTAGGAPMIVSGYNLVSGGPTSEILQWDSQPEPWGTWSSVTPTGAMVQGRVLPSVARWWDTSKDAQWGEVVFIYGGESADKSPFTNTIQRYDSRSNTWSVDTNVLPVSMNSGAAAAIPPGPADTSGVVQVLLFGGRTATGLIDWTFRGNTDIPVNPVVTVYPYWTEIAANLEGSFGSQWRTDVVARNLGAADASVDFLLHIDSTTAYLLQDVTIAPGAQGVVEDIVGLMNYTGKGALEILSTERLQVSSRMYNQAASGTFGQYFDGYEWSDGLRAGDSAWLLQLRQLTDTFRTNISVTNTGFEPASVRITLFATDGSELHTYTLDVPETTVYQDSQPFNYRAGSPDLGWGFARVEVVAGTGLLCSASVVDSGTNDATTIPMQR